MPPTHWRVRWNGKRFRRKSCWPERRATRVVASRMLAAHSAPVARLPIPFAATFDPTAFLPHGAFTRRHSPMARLPHPLAIPNPIARCPNVMTAGRPRDNLPDGRWRSLRDNHRRAHPFTDDRSGLAHDDVALTRRFAPCDNGESRKTQNKNKPPFHASNVPLMNANSSGRREKVSMRSGVAQSSDHERCDKQGNAREHDCRAARHVELIGQQCAADAADHAED